MTAYRKIICVFSIAVGFAFASAADSTIKKVKLINSDEIKINNDGRVLQEFEYTCDAENLALATCGSATLACYESATRLVIPATNWCSMSYLMWTPSAEQPRT